MFDAKLVTRSSFCHVGRTASQNFWWHSSFDKGPPDTLLGYDPKTWASTPCVTSPFRCLRSDNDVDCSIAAARYAPKHQHCSS
eukprot:2668531-Amphidinium_carterae.1